MMKVSIKVIEFQGLDDVKVVPILNISAPVGF